MNYIILAVTVRVLTLDAFGVITDAVSELLLSESIHLDQCTVHVQLRVRRDCHARNFYSLSGKMKTALPEGNELPHSVSECHICIEIMAMGGS